jgi:hypothetical protein
MKKDYKVEALIFEMKASFSSNNLKTQPKIEIQEQLDLYSSKGYRLVSTNSSGDATTIYVYLYFEKDI